MQPETEASRAVQAVPPSVQPVSGTMCIVPILGCLFAAEQELGPNKEWRPINKQQQRLTELHQRTRGSMPQIPELKSACSRNFAVVNTFLAQNGFPGLQIDQKDRLTPQDFAVASILKLILKWIVAGKAPYRCSGSEPSFFSPKLSQKRGVSPSENQPCLTCGGRARSTS